MNSRRLSLIVFVSVIIALGFGYVSRVIFPSILSGSAIVFRQSGTEWEVLPRIPGSPAEIRITAGGTVWVYTHFKGGLGRLEDKTWRLYTGPDFGPETNYVSGHFALDGEEVWATTDDGVSHFNGSRWQHYSETMVTADGTSIAAGGGQAWVIDREARLFHFDGAWSNRKLHLPGVQWGGPMDRKQPSLAVTPNHSLWLVWNGLWKNDGDSWTRTAPELESPELLGAAGDALWLREDSAIYSVAMDDGTARRYGSAEMGLPDSARVYGVAGPTGHIVFATSEGLVHHEGGIWHAPIRPGFGIVSVSNVAVAPEGTIFGIGSPPAAPPLERLRPLILFGGLPIFIGIPLLIVLGREALRWSRRDPQLMHDAILHATGTVPGDLEPSAAPTGAQISTRVGIALTISIGGFFALQHYWPATPYWLIFIVPMVVHLLTVGRHSLQKRKLQPSDPIEPGGSSRYDWKRSLPAILGGLALILILNLASVGHIGNLKSIPRLAPIGILVGAYVAFSLYDLFRCRLVERAVERGQYRRAFEILEGPLRFPPWGYWKVAHARALMFAGRFTEAKPLIREVIDSRRGRVERALALEVLGQILLDTDHFDEAQRAFESAAQLLPEHSGAPNGLAEVLLRQNREPRRALEFTEQALQLHRASMVQRKTARERFGAICANQAWALALLGRSSEARKAIEEGLRGAPETDQPSLAGLNWRAGMAMLALSDTAAAAGHFRRGAELDPQGYYGRRAAAQLRDVQVWGAAGTSASR